MKGLLDMSKEWGQMEVDELNDETFTLLRKGSLGDRMRAYEKFKEDPESDRVLLEKLLNLIKKEYSAKFMQSMALQQMCEDDPSS